MLLVIGADQQFVPARELPTGRIVFPILPNKELVNEGPLVFELYAGREKVGESVVTTPGAQAVFFGWEARAKPLEQMLRVRVTSGDEKLAAKLTGATQVYLLLEWPWFEPAP